MTSHALPSASGAASLELVPGATIAGKYTLVRPIGVGGMGAVWLACNEATGAEVALKVLLPNPNDVAELNARFRREAYTTASLCHRGIIRIYDLIEIAGEDQSSLVLVMELLRGQTLAAFLQEKKRLALEDALAIILPVLSALAYAHEAGIVHRDLKPENIFLAVDPDGLITPKILDFGISKASVPKAPIITREGEMLGTPSYMSPEQVRGKSSVEAQSDIFNVGILLYEMLSGQNPFAGAGMHSMVVAILEDTPVPIAGIDREVWKVIERALRKSPAERFSSARELTTALRMAVGLPLTPSILPAAHASGIQRALPSETFPFALSLKPVLSSRARSRWRTWAVAVFALAVASAASASIAWGSLAHRATTTKEVEPARRRPAVIMVDAVEGPISATEAHVRRAPATTSAPGFVARKSLATPPAIPRRAGIVRDPGF